MAKRSSTPKNVVNPTVISTLEPLDPGDESITAPQVAAMLGIALDQPVEVVELPAADIAEQRKEFLSVANILRRHMPIPAFEAQLQSNYLRIMDQCERLEIPMGKPEMYLRAVHQIEIHCVKCSGTGQYHHFGECMRCLGKGYMTVADLKRNWGYDSNAHTRIAHFDRLDS